MSNATVGGLYNVTGTTYVSSLVNFVGNVTSVGHTLTVENGSADFHNNSFSTGTLNFLGRGGWGDAILKGAGNLTVTGLFDWVSGTLQGGTLTVAAGATMNLRADQFLNTGVHQVLDGVTLNNAGTAVWFGGTIGGDIIARNGAVVNNTGTFDVRTTRYQPWYFDGIGAAPTINNAGQFLKSAGTEEARIGIRFNNSGTVSVQSGGLGLNGGGNSSGSFSAVAGAGIGFGGSHVLTNASSVTGTGNFSFNNATIDGTYNVTGTTYVSGIVNFTGTVSSVGHTLTVENGTVDFHNNSFSTGTLNFLGHGGWGDAILKGTGNLTVTGLFDWVGGTLQGCTLTVAAGATMNLRADQFLNTAVHQVLDGVTLNNAGTAIWGPSVIGGNITTRNGPVINNVGTFDVRGTLNPSAARFLGHDGVGAAGTFNNSGTFQKSAGTDVTLVRGVAFNNSGTVDIQQSRVSLDFGGVSSGTFMVAAGAFLGFSGSHLLGATSSATGAGTIAFSGGPSTVAGTYAVSGTTELGLGNGDECFVDFTGDVQDMGTLSVRNAAVDFHANSFSTTNLNFPTPGSFPGVLKTAGDILVSGTFDWMGGALQGPGTVTVQPGGTMYLRADHHQGVPRHNILDGVTLVNAGTAIWTGGAIGGNVLARNGAVFNNTGAFDVRGDRFFYYDGVGAIVAFNNSGLVKKSAGTGNSIIGIPFINNSTVAAQSGMLSFGTFVQNSGTTILDGGSISAALNLQGGSIEGVGQVFGNVLNAGEADPGFSPGVIQINGNYSQVNSGALKIELGGGAPGNSPSDHDQLDVRGMVALNGALNVSLINGFAPAPDQTFVIIRNDGTDAVTGTFSGVPECGLVTAPDGSQFKVSYVGGDGNDVMITYINHPPTANPDVASTNEDSPVTVAVLDNDTDIDSGDTLTVTSVTILSGLGTVSTNGTTVTYNPGAAYNYLAVGQCAIVTIAYAISDGHPNGTDDDTLTITIHGRNDAPHAEDHAFTVAEDGSVSGNLLDGASDPDHSDQLSVITIVGANHGVVTFQANGNFTYTPGVGCESASDSFTYTISDGHLGGKATATVTITIVPNTGVTSVDGVLRVGGISGSDVVRISGGNLIVNGTPHSLAGVSDIRIWGRAGNDDVDLSGTSIKSFIHGGNGNDVISGGAGDDLIFGGAGDDQITGAAGNDFLIGGDGRDRIVGSAGHDILVAGEVGCELTLETLRLISLEWANSHSASESDAIDAALDEANDDDYDTLTGGAGADLFIIDTGDKITDFQFGKPQANKDGDVVIRNGVVVY